MAEKIPFDVAGNVLKVGDTVAYPMKNGMYVILKLGKIVEIDLTRSKPFVSIQRHIWKPGFVWVIRADNTSLVVDPGAKVSSEIDLGPLKPKPPPKSAAVELTFAEKRDA